MKPLTIFRKKPKSHYLLEIVETSVPSTVKKAKVKGGFSPAKKAVSAAIIGLLMTLGIATSATAVAVKPTESNAFLEDIAVGILCSTKDSPYAYLGGTSDTLTKGWNQDQKTSPVGNGINVTVPASLIEKNKPVGKWTALEQYGYYAPTFETWNGIYVKASDFKDKPAPFYGSGGKGSTEQYGNLIGVKDPAQSRFFNNSPLGCTNLGPNFNAGVGNFLFGITKFAVAIASESYSVASTMVISTTDTNSPLKGLSEGVEKLVTGDSATGQKGLKDILFLDWLVAIIFLGAIALAWTGLVKRSSLQAGQGALWMIGATVAGFLFVTYPMAVPGMVSNVVGEFNRSLTAALVQTNGTGDTLCTVKPTKNASADSVRQVKCSIWYTTVYSPWVKGQFGMEEHKLVREADTTYKWMYTDTAQSSRVVNGETVKTQAVAPDGDPDGSGFEAAKENAPKAIPVGESRGVLGNAKINFGAEAYAGKTNWAIYMLDRQNNWTKNRGVDYSEIAFNQLVVNKNSHWAGADDAVGSGFMSIFAAAGPVAILVSLSFAMIGYQIAMLFLIVFSPLLFLLGVAPGWGRGIAMRWLELVAGLLVKQIVLALFLVLYVKLYILIIQAGLEWWIQALVVLVLSMVGISQRERITQMVSGAINFGGDRRIDDGGQIRQQLAQGTRKTMDLAGRGTIATGRLTKKGGAAAIRSVPGSARAVKNSAVKAKQNAAKVVTNVKDAETARTKMGHQSSVRRQNAYDKVNANNLDYSKLTEAERTAAGVREHTRRPGQYVVNRKKAEKFITAKKAEFLQKDKEIQNRYKQSKIEKRENLKKAKTREERAAVIEKAKNERALARQQSKTLHENSVKYFGEDRGVSREAAAKAVGRGKKPTYQTRKTNRDYKVTPEPTPKGKKANSTPNRTDKKTNKENSSNSSGDNETRRSRRTQGNSNGNNRRNRN